MNEEDRIKIESYLATGFGIGYFHTLLDRKLISKDEYEKLLLLFNKKMQNYSKINKMSRETLS